MDFTVAIGIGHTVINGILQNGLNDQLDGVEGLYTALRRNIGGEFIFVAHFLNGEIVSGMLQLIGNGNDVAAPAQRDAEKASKSCEHYHRILRAAIFRHPHHTVQGVVKEMGIDLGLQHIQFAAALLLLLFQDVVHQMAQRGDHGLDRAA